jgi:hypothetical protein
MNARPVALNPGALQFQRPNCVCKQNHHPLEPAMRPNAVLCLLFPLLLAMVFPAHADWDAKTEAREQAEREARAREQAAREREGKRIVAEAQAKIEAEQRADRRRQLGAVAQGKSDAEVDRLYAERSARATAEAAAATRQAQRAMATPEAQAGMRAVTGHSMQELQSMSPEELEALSKQLESRYSKDE